MKTHNPFRFHDDAQGRLRLGEQIAILAMPGKERRRLVKGIATQVRTDARQNIRQQKTISGSPMAPRKQTRNKRKLLRRMGKGMVVFNRGNDRAIVTWKKTVAGRIAKRQQEGNTQRMTAVAAARRGRKPDYDAPASRDMARSLMQEGYRQPVKGKNGRVRLKKVSQRWIMDNLTQGQAGLVLKEMRGTGGKRSWLIRTPARAFLGATEQDARRMLEAMARQQVNKIKRK